MFNFFKKSVPDEPNHGMYYCFIRKTLTDPTNFRFHKILDNLSHCAFMKTIETGKYDIVVYDTRQCYGYNQIPCNRELMVVSDFVLFKQDKNTVYEMVKDRISGPCLVFCTLADAVDNLKIRDIKIGAL